MKLLRQENRFLRDQLEFPHRDKPRFPLPNTAEEFKRRPQNGKNISTYFGGKKFERVDGSQRFVTFHRKSSKEASRPIKNFISFFDNFPEECRLKSFE